MALNLTGHGMLRLDGKVALVTGGGPVGHPSATGERGPGMGIAMRLGAQGATVAVNDIVPERAQETVDRIVADGGTAAAFPFDVTDLAAVRRGVADIEVALGPVDIHVNNAGLPAGYQPAPFLDIDPSEWPAMIDLNVYGLLNCASVLLPGMCARGFGRVVVVSAVCGSVGLNSGVAVYGAAKGAQVAFIRNMAQETARKGVTLNAVVLGRLTNRIDDFGDLPAVNDSVPIGRVGTPADVSAAVAYLVSDEAAWVTGHVMGLHGGKFTT
ncbi:MAG: SDR family NAD(P)-dependent oxidoreductase [Acidimicrobiales bacterium]